LSRPRVRLSPSKIIRSETSNLQPQDASKRARKVEFTVKDAVKSDDLEDNRNDQLIQAPVIISPLMRVF